MDKINSHYEEQYYKLLHIYGNETATMEALRANIQSEQGIMFAYVNNNINNKVNSKLNKINLIDTHDTIDDGILNLQSTLDNCEFINSEILQLNYNDDDYLSTAEFNTASAIGGIENDFYVLEKTKFERSLAIMSVELNEPRHLELSTEEKSEQPKLINKGKSFHDQKK